MVDTSFRELIRGSSVIVFGTVLDLGLSFVIQLLMARYLGPSQFGLISLGYVVLLTLTSFAVLGIDEGVARNLPRYETSDKENELVTSAFYVILVTSIAVGAAVSVSSGYLARFVFDEPAIEPILRIFGFTVPLVAIMHLVVGVTRGHKRSAPRVLIKNVILPVVRLSGIAVVALFGGGVLGIAWAHVLTYVVVALVSVAVLIRYTSPLSNRPDRSQYRELLVFSVPLSITTMSAFLLSYFDTLLLGLFASIDSVGVYRAVYPLANMLLISVNSLSFLFMPIVSELNVNDDHDRIERIYELATKWAFVVTVPVLIVFLRFPEPIIAVSFGPEYTNGGFTLVVLAVGFFGHVVAGPNSTALISFGKSKIVMYNTLVAIGVNFGLNLYLIPRYSFFGAAIATAIAYVLLNLLHSHRLYVETGIDGLSTGLFRSGIVAAIVASGLYLTTVLVSNVYVLGLLVLLLGSAYVALLVRFVMDDEEWELVHDVGERLNVN